MKEQAMISIIMPCFNASEYIEETLDSILQQTYTGQIEVLLMDDASTDNTVEVIENLLTSYTRENISFHLIKDQQNQGQGYRRNRGIEQATGEFLLFLDADDFIHPDTLKVAVTKMTPSMDAVLFDWAYYYPETKNTVYVNKEKYLINEELRGAECEQLLMAQSFFTVNKLYRKEFLTSQNISFGEGYLYEDLEFYVAVAQYAKHIGIIPNIFYKVRVHGNSSTKSAGNTMIHYHSYLKAIEKTCQLMDFRQAFSTYHLYKYLMLRSLLYASRRMPKKVHVRNKFVKESMNILNQYGGDYEVPKGLSPIYYYGFTQEKLKNNKYKSMRYYYWLQEKNLINAYKQSISMPYEKSIFSLPAKMMRKVKKNKESFQTDKKYKTSAIEKGKIFMLGFDNKYMGNSKYLFDYLCQYYGPDQLKFVTSDQSVPEAYRVKARTTDFLNHFYSSEFIIGESWISMNLDKKEGQTWIQLWHGTPLKKLLFDSTELAVMQQSPAHKVNLKKDIERWDLLLSDSLPAVDKFVSSLDINREKIVNFGYPRNQWLLENNNNTQKKAIMERLNIDENKKVVLYAPTWRDYNYKKTLIDFDTSYLADLKKLQEAIGDDYQIIFKGHDMEAAVLGDIPGIMTVGGEVDTQELILISDTIVTDYSSIIFDGIHLDTNIVMFVNDLRKYTIVRGVYSDLFADFAEVTVDNEADLAQLIKQPRHLDLLDKYKNDNLAIANEQLKKFIEK